MGALPSKRLDAERLAILFALFTDDPLSSDLRQLILDYAFPRYSLEYTFKDRIHHITLSIAQINSHYCLAIRDYSDKHLETISTFSINRPNLATTVFSNICAYIDEDIPDRTFENHVINNIPTHARYAYFPRDDETYRLEHIDKIRSDLCCLILLHRISDPLSNHIKIGYYKTSDKARFELKRAQHILQDTPLGSFGRSDYFWYTPRHLILERYSQELSKDLPKDEEDDRPCRSASEARNYIVNYVTD